MKQLLITECPKIVVVDFAIFMSDILLNVNLELLTRTILVIFLEKFYHHVTINACGFPLLRYSVLLFDGDAF